MDKEKNIKCIDAISNNRYIYYSIFELNEKEIYSRHDDKGKFFRISDRLYCFDSSLTSVCEVNNPSIRGYFLDYETTHIEQEGK